jgi:hypothetical protein
VLSEKSKQLGRMAVELRKPRSGGAIRVIGKNIEKKSNFREKIK